MIVQGNAVDCVIGTTCVVFAAQIGLTGSAAVTSGSHTISCQCSYTAGPSCYASGAIDYWTSP